MKVERLVKLLRAAVLKAKENVKRVDLVTQDAYCVPVEIGGVGAPESDAALSVIHDDKALMNGIRKIREYGPGKWVVEPYTP